MAKNIKQMADEYARAYLFSPQNAKGPDEHYIDGANAVLEEIENFMKGIYLGNRAEERLYKLDILADIGLFIEQLKK